MRTQHCRFILAGAAAFVLAACGGNQSVTKEAGVVDIPAAMKNLGEVTTSQLGSKISFVPLQTSDSVLVGERFDLKPVADKIVVANLSGDYTIMVFDMANGKFLNNIGHFGQGPEDYLFPIAQAGVNDDKIFLIPASGSGKIIYTLNGDFAGTFQISPDSSTLPQTFISSSDTLLTFLGNDPEDSSRRFAFLTYGLSGHIVDSCVVFDGQQAAPGFRTYSGQGSFFHFPSPLSKASSVIGGIKEGDRHTLITTVATQEVDNEIHFLETLCDTVFRLTPSGVEPSLIFDFGSKGFPFSEVNRRLPSSSEMFVMQRVESPSKVLFAFSEGWLGDDAHKEYIGVYDRRSGETIVADAKSGIRDDLGGFMPFSPLATTADGRWLGVLTMEQIEEWLEKNPDVERPGWLANSTSEDNPVLVIISD